MTDLTTMLAELAERAETDPIAAQDLAAINERITAAAAAAAATVAMKRKARARAEAIVAATPAPAVERMRAMATRSVALYAATRDLVEDFRTAERELEEVTAHDTSDGTTPEDIETADQVSALVGWIVGTDALLGAAKLVAELTGSLGDDTPEPQVLLDRLVEIGAHDPHVSILVGLGAVR